MSSHIAPHLWADAIAGSIAPQRLDMMERHAAGCPRCARARNEVERATSTFAAIRNQVAPAVGWDSVRARVHWSVSTAKHSRVGMRVLPRPTLRTLSFALGCAFLVAGGIVAYVAIRRTPTEPAAVRVAVPPVPAPIHAVVTKLAGDAWVDGVEASDVFARPFAVGTTLTTGEGQIDIQLGDSSGVSLGARSTLRFRQLNVTAIELEVDGLVDIDLRQRTPGERFVVAAGSHTIEVRGTRFLVEHDARGTRVACHHGRVDVTAAERSDAVAVEAARTALFAPNVPVSDVQPVALSPDEIGKFGRSAPWTMPVWTDVLAHSGPLRVTATAGRQIRVDGIEIGAAPVQMRVMLGRHTIETADAYGRFHRAGWVDVRAGHTAAFEVVEPVARPASATIARRKKEFADGLDRNRLLACTRRLAKSGLSDTVKFEIAVDADGAINMMNVTDTDLPGDTAACVHDVLSSVRFRPGPAASWRDRLDL